MSARRREKLTRRAGRKNKKRAWELKKDLEVAMAVLPGMAEAAAQDGGVIGVHGEVLRPTEKMHRLLALPENARARELREALRKPGGRA